MSRVILSSTSLMGLISLALFGVACGGGRSSAWQDDSDADPAGGWGDPELGSGGAQSGGRASTATITTGGAVYIARGGTGTYYANTGGHYQSSGGYAAGGRTGTGGFGSKGGQSSAGVGGYGTGGYGIGGYGIGGYGIGGYGIGGYGIGGYGIGGYGIGGYKSGGAGTAGHIESFGVGGGGVAGSAGTAGSEPCNPARTSDTSMAGAAGTLTRAEWYVDAQNGSDVGPGTKSQPLKTLNCAAIAAQQGATVYLLNGTWNSSVEPRLGRESSLACGVESGIAFASNVALRAAVPGSARIVNGASHGICMKGGVVEGIRFECASTGPVIETQEGSLEIRGSSMTQCGTPGLNVSGIAQVVMRPGALADYSENPNPNFAYLNGLGSLTIEGGKISYAGLALQLQDSAQVNLHGVTLTSQDPTSMAGPGIMMTSGSPRLVIDGDSRMDNVATGINTSQVSAEIAIDGLTFSRGVNFLQGTLETTSSLPKISINRLTVSDCSGFGVGLNGTFALSITNSNFIRCGAPSIMPTGSGRVTIDSVVVSGGWGGPIISGDEDGGVLAVQVRRLEATGGQYAGAIIWGYPGDSFDFGTANSPGNNVLRGNNTLLNATYGNFIFQLPAGVIAQAVGNTWDPNQQGADAAGHYPTNVAGTPFDLASGTGPNLVSGADNAGVVRLAENPPTGG